MREIRYRARGGGWRIQLEGARGCRSQVYFPPRRRLIARQRRHVNDGNDGADEAKANGCIQRTKALLCSRHVIDGEWVHGFPPRRRGEEITVERIGDDALGATRRIGKDALLTSLARLSPPICARIVSRRKRVIYVARRLTFTVLYMEGRWNILSLPTSNARIESFN